MVKIFLLKCYTFWVYLVFTVFMLILLPFILVPIMVNERYGNISFLSIKLWAWIFSRLTFVKYKAFHTENIKQGKTYIYTCNHSSFLDAPALPLTIPGQFRPLGKVELMKIPVFGWIVKSVAVLVDRSSPESRQKSVARLSLTLQKGISIFIFPEGTTNKTNKPLTPFYDGAFRIAIENQAPIMPMVILNSKNLMPRGKLLNKPGTIKVIFGKAVETCGLTMDDLPDLKHQVFAIMEKMILEEGTL